MSTRHATRLSPSAALLAALATPLLLANLNCGDLDPQGPQNLTSASTALGGDWLTYESTVGETLTNLAYASSLDLPSPTCFDTNDPLALKPSDVEAVIGPLAPQLPTEVRQWVEDVLSFPDYRGFLLEDVLTTEYENPTSTYTTDFIFLPNPTGSSRPLPGTTCGSLEGVSIDINGDEEWCFCCKIQGTLPGETGCGCTMICQPCPNCPNRYYGTCVECITAKPQAPAFVEEECGGHRRYACTLDLDSVPFGVGLAEACIGW